MTADQTPRSAGARFRRALAEEKPLQIAGTINAYHARLATASGFRAIYVSGGGVLIESARTRTVTVTPRRASSAAW